MYSDFMQKYFYMYVYALNLKKINLWLWFDKMLKWRLCVFIFSRYYILCIKYDSLIYSRRPRLKQNNSLTGIKSNILAFKRCYFVKIIFFQEHKHRSMSYYCEKKIHIDVIPGPNQEVNTFFFKFHQLVTFDNSFHNIWGKK